MSITRRRLPHDYPPGKWLFLTWHLHGSLPHGSFPPPDKASAGEAFVWIDRYLDQATSGPVYLRQPAIARIVIASLHKGAALGDFELGAFVVMANHVHVLLLPKVHPSRLLQSMKGSTAHEANRILGLTGKPFWQGNPTTIGSATNSSMRASPTISRTIRSRQAWRRNLRSTGGRAHIPANASKRCVVFSSQSAGFRFSPANLH
ncbi:MAG TPA: hypothetical protein PLZ95_22080, partial [Bryobacteraceae bacterium]|nr:hypothetical protein [Bryobacteraceae bacterium]